MLCAPSKQHSSELCYSISLWSRMSACGQLSWRVLVEYDIWYFAHVPVWWNRSQPFCNGFCCTLDSIIALTFIFSVQVRSSGTRHQRRFINGSPFCHEFSSLSQFTYVDVICIFRSDSLSIRLGERQAERWSFLPSTLESFGTDSAIY